MTPSSEFWRWVSIIPELWWRRVLKYDVKFELCTKTGVRQPSVVAAVEVVKLCAIVSSILELWSWVMSCDVYSWVLMSIFKFNVKPWSELLNSLVALRTELWHRVVSWLYPLSSGYIELWCPMLSYDVRSIAMKSSLELRYLVLSYDIYSWIVTSGL